MVQETLKRSNGSRYKLLIVGSAALALFIALAFWGGRPPQERMVAFSIGIVVLALALCGFALLAWHLLIRPLPAGHKVPDLNMLKARYRQLLALLVGISGINLVVGGFWDEVWHRQYGIPFGEDLFWRPHLLIYSSIVLIFGLAGWGLVDMLRNGKGSVQQRFRANPIVGLLILVGAFMMFALPADPVWHVFYGEDITAWSIPHIVLTFSFVLVMILAAAIQLSTLSPRNWTTLRHARAADFLVILVLAFTLTVSLQVLTTDWDSDRLFLLQQRPEWLLPTVVVALGVLIGVLANHSLRYAGAATLTGLLALTIRFVLIQAFNYQEVSLSAWINVLQPMLALDLWYGYCLARRERPPSPISVGLVAMVGMTFVSFPLLNQFYAYPQIDLTNLPLMIMAGAIGAVGAGWVGQTVGDYLATEHKQIEDTMVTNRHVRLVPPLAFISIVTFIFIFVATAASPV